MLQRFKESLKGLIEFEYELLPITDAPPILIALSGGVDSMCMATLFFKSCYPNFAVATVNFSLRGEESDGDEALVKEWCKSNNKRCHSIVFDTKEYAAQKKISIQMAARELRYSWFKELSEEHGYQYIALAHNLNDSVETLFLNLLRGSGLKGLRGIPSKNHSIIRPLLPFSREEIEYYVKQEKVEFREDSSNRENQYSRNRLRNLLFPHFKAINPNFLHTISASIERIKDAETILDQLYELKKGKLLDKSGTKVSIKELLSDNNSSFWLYKILEPYGFKGSILSQIESSLMGEPGRVFHSTTHTLLRDREWLIISKIKKIEESFGVEKLYKIELTTLVEESLSFQFLQQSYNFLLLSSQQAPSTKEQFRRELEKSPPPHATLYLDFSKIILAAKGYENSIVIRNWREGDRVHPIGMKGSKKVSDIFIDLKLDRLSKKRVPLLVIGERVVALLGYMINRNFKVESDTTTLLKIESSVSDTPF